MKTMLKRSMAILLILMMVISVLPLSAMAATVSSTYYPLYVTMASETGTTWSMYYKNTNNTYSSGNKSSKTTYFPWNPSTQFENDYKSTYKSNGYIPVDKLKNEFQNTLIDDGVWYRTSTSSYSATSAEYTSDKGYTWEIVPEITAGVLIPEIEYFTLAIRVYKDNARVGNDVTIYVENPFVAEDYTLKYSVTKTPTDGSANKNETNKTFSSSTASVGSDLYVTLATVSGSYDKDSFNLTTSFNTTEDYLTLNTPSDFVEVASSEWNSEPIKTIKKNTNFDKLYKATVTVTPRSGYYLRVTNGTVANTATITFYQPVSLGYIDLLTIGDQVILKAVDPTDPDTYKWIGKEVGDAVNSTTALSATYDLTDITTASPQYAIKVVNNTSKATTAYTVRVAKSEQGTCNVTSFNLGTYEMDYRPELKGDTKHEIVFDILPNNNESKKITLKFTIQFAGGATEAQYVTDNLSYTTVAGSSVTFELSSLIKNFANFSDEQKAQFTFKITDFTDDDNQDFGNYFISYQGNSSTAGVTTLTNDGNGDGKPGLSSYVDNSCFLDDYKIVYKANRNTIASDNHGFTVRLTNTTSDGTYTDSFKVKFSAAEAAQPSMKSDPSTLSVKPNSTSNTLKLANYINNFNVNQNLTYKVTSVSGDYGTFVDENGSSVSTSTGGSISASTGFQYKGTTDSDNRYDTLKVAVYYNGGSLGTLTITAKCDPGVDCYTKSEFDSSYGDDNAFGVYLYNAKDRYYSFDRDDFVNGDADFTDDEYEGTNDYIKVTTLPIGGSLSGLDRNNEIDVAQLDDLKYVRTGATDTGIDCFKFTLYNDGSRDGTYVMWIVGNESYLDAETGYTEAQFKASYGEKDAFGKYAGSSGVTFAASDFTNGSVKLSTDYSDAYIEIVDEPIIGTLKNGSSTLEEEDRVAVADLAKLKYTWEDYDKENIDKFTFYLYKSSSSSSKAVSTKFTMWIVGNSALLSGDSEAWSGTSTTMPIYKVTDVEVSDNIASVTLDEAWVTEALETVKAGSDVTVAVTPKSEAKGLSLTVDSSLFTLANASKIMYITLSEGTSGASVSVSVSDILSAGGSGKDFTVTLNKLTISTANDIVANSLVASTATAARSVSFKAGTANITFDSVGAAVLSIPYSNSSSYSDEMVVIYDYSGGNTPLVSSEFTGRYATADISKGGQYLVAVNSISFSDVSANWAWTRGYIPSLAARGTISGMGGQNAGKYMPDGKLTRAEFIKLLVVSLGLEDASATNPFSDMSDHWAKQVVAAAVKHSIINSGTTFSPDEAITRRDMALYAYRAAQAAGLTLSSSGSTTTFKDENEITGEYLTAVKAMQAAGIINGMGGQYEGYYLPMNNTDRAAAAKIIWFLNAELYGWNTSGKY